MQNTEINWTELTWGTVSGCTKLGPECQHCYAYTLAENKRGTKAFPNGFEITMRPWKLDEPKKIRRPSLIFCNSTSDWFHEQIPDSYRDDMFAAIEAAPRHRYQVLTKRPENAVRYFTTRKVPPSVWLGATVGVRDGLWRVDALRSIDARVRFLSCEPLLEQLDGIELGGIHWVIGGGESGFHASTPKLLESRFMVRRGGKGEPNWIPRDDRLPWARHLREATKASGAAFWWKQHGGPLPKSGGRILDGRTWDELPTHIPGAMPEGYEHRAAAKQAEAKRQLTLVA